MSNLFPIITSMALNTAHRMGRGRGRFSFIISPG